MTTHPNAPIVGNHNSALHFALRPAVNIEKLTVKFGTPVAKSGTIIFNSHTLSDSISIRSTGGNNILVLPRNSVIGKIHVDFRSTNSCAFIEFEATRANILMGYGCVMYIGSGATFTNSTNFTLAEEKDIFIGPNCMFAENIFASNTDGHPIFSQDGERINHGRSILIGEHVWAGRGSEILKGSVVHSGSVIGARSLVSGTIPPNSICIGSPARVIRTDIHFGRVTTVREKIINQPETTVFFSDLDTSNYEGFVMAQDFIGRPRFT